MAKKQREIDAAIDAIQDRFEKSEKETADRFEEARREVESWTKDAIKGELERYRVVRVTAAALLLAGLACQAFANFIN